MSTCEFAIKKLLLYIYEYLKTHFGNAIWGLCWYNSCKFELVTSIVFFQTVWGSKLGSETPNTEELILEKEPYFC